MMNLETSYMGIKLRNPLIVSSSGLTDSIDKIKAAAEYGAGAVVLKSIFEEQINYQSGMLTKGSDYPEASDYIAYYTKTHSLDNYLKLIRSAKESAGIPIIPSINCVSADDWINFARNIQSAGADALEVNMFFMPVDKELKPVMAEKLYFDLVEKLRETLDIPFAIKLGQRFTNLLYLIDQLYNRGVNGVVLFNRFFEPDIDVNSMNIIPASVFSNADDKRNVLRWIGMASAVNDRISISASTGVRTGDDIVKYLLAGADTVQVCSVLYSEGYEYISELLASLKSWMKSKNYKRVDEFRAMLNYRNFKDYKKYERAQFMKYFSAYE
ncbi:MAG TPA: dihydroorotate dehydrogenase-like protein [Bacteroidetes bacterium]|nr:dihydroorotate dehydrogenase-like protein [Bacteroidota bacterium]